MEIRILNGGPCATNCIIVKCEDTKKAIVIDPAFNTTGILEEIKGYDTQYIIVTHAHMDHIMALDEVKNATGADIIISKDESAFLNDTYYNLAEFMQVPSPRSKADITVNDGDTLPFGNYEIKFILTPGHTKGSMCIFLNDTIFSGDTLFNQGIGRYDLPGGSQEQILKSIKEKLLVYPDDVTVYPGHGPKTTIGYEKQNNFFIL